MFLAPEKNNAWETPCPSPANALQGVYFMNSFLLTAVGYVPRYISDLCGAFRYVAGRG
jgi:hypothetical protein